MPVHSGSFGDATFSRRVLVSVETLSPLPEIRSDCTISAQAHLDDVLLARSFLASVSRDNRDITQT
jgi:hypothetical protein